MTGILRIDSSARPMSGGSRNRELADSIVAQLRAMHPGAEFVTRDLAAAPLPHITDKTIAAFYTPTAQVSDSSKDTLALSDALITELCFAEVVVISVPIYNFSTPQRSRPGPIRSRGSMRCSPMRMANSMGC